MPELSSFQLRQEQKSSGCRSPCESFHNFADLHDARHIRVVLLVGNKGLCRSGECALEFLDRAEKQMPHRVIGRRRTGGKPADSSIDLRPYKAARAKQLA